MKIKYCNSIDVIMVMMITVIILIILMQYHLKLHCGGLIFFFSYHNIFKQSGLWVCFCTAQRQCGPAFKSLKLKAAGLGEGIEEGCMLGNEAARGSLKARCSYCLSGIGGLFCGGDSSTRGQLGLLNRGEEFHTHPSVCVRDRLERGKGILISGLKHHQDVLLEKLT